MAVPRRALIGARLLDWHVASRPARGEVVSGDRAHVDGALVAVIDGVGHGEPAAEASGRAVAALEQAACMDPVALVEHCHRALAGTRGAALGVGCLDALSGTLSWAGVGNVEGRVVRARTTETLLLTDGVAGHALAPLRATTVPLDRGDLLVLATDGVDRAFADGLAPAGSCSAIAEHILEEHARASDDALVLVLRYLGGGP